MNAPNRTVLHAVASLRGGATTVVLQLARGLEALGFESHVLAPGDAPALVESEEFRSIRWTEWRQDRGYVHDVLQRLHPGILHCHGHRAGLLRRHLPAERPRVVMTFHGFHIPHYRNPLYRWAARAWERRALRRTDGVIFVSNSDAEIARPWLGELPCPSTVIPNAVELSRFVNLPSREEARAALNLPQGEFMVGCIGRLHYQKSPETLVHAARELPDVHIVFAGDGPLLQRMRQLAERLRVRATFLPPRPDVERLYAALDLLVLPSRWEGLPLVLLEAGVAGIPVIATDVPGTREVITHEATGLLVPPGDPAALAAAIRRAREHPEESAARADALRQRIGERFTLDRMLRSTADFYRKVS